MDSVCLVLLLLFNNESAYREETEKTAAGCNYTVDFSVDVNPERTGPRNNGTFYGGATINKTSVLKFKATKIGKDTMLAQIIKTVEEAMSSKAPIQLLADKVSFYFVPAVILIAIFSFFVWIASGQSFVFALTIFVTVLIVACLLQ